MAVEDEEAAFFSTFEGQAAGSSWIDLPGLGAANQARLLAAFELGRRYALFRERRARARDPGKTGRLELSERAIRSIPLAERSQSREWLGFVPVYVTGAVGQFCVAEQGSRTHVNVDPVELFARILALRPRGFFLFHNHPSGNLQPSPADLDLTRKTARVAEQLGIQLLGHGVVSARGERWIVI